MSLALSITLDDKYRLESGRLYLSGVQALVRLPMLQKERDRAAGLVTAGFISGYRGSPLGGLDKELWRAQDFLARHDVRFQPGLNEELAATAIWGTQQTGLFPGSTVEGVFALWYGKGPGVDRSLDALKHGNAAGSSARGGVLVVAGDDHAARSSTLPHQSEQVFMAAGIPVLNPAGVQELLDYGLIGWAMSRFSGLWVGLKAIAETVESSATVILDPSRAMPVSPEFAMPAGGLSIRWPDPFLAQESRLLRHKLRAALAFARANRLDREIVSAPQPRFGIVTTGKSSLDVLQALEDIGIDEAHAAEIGISVYKVGMSWPLEQDGMRAFAQGLDEILVVEEKRPLIEEQLKAELYNWREDVRPRVVGKEDEEGRWLLPAEGELAPALIARVIAARIGRFYTSIRIKERLEFLDAKERALSPPPADFVRTPYFCAGCPHNSSTILPEGSRAMGGIGCHIMAIWMPDRATLTYSQMGGEGCSWIGQAPYVADRHVFQNLGDGTYFHSGLLAIRACIAARVNITYKILYNDAVAMTGGQPVDGPLSVPMIAAQLRAEGVTRIAVAGEDPRRYDRTQFPPGTSFHHRDALDALQRELRDIKGVSALIFDQTCAAEKRRRRKRGLMADPDERLFINELVCEGCGDCTIQSNCVAIVPVETEFGRKRAVDQSVCNKDMSCLKGFCPSFVTVKGAKLKSHQGVGDQDRHFTTLPQPVLPSSRDPYGIVIAGIGGTGVVTIAQILGMAAHVSGLGVTALDQTGLAQKNGAVVSHVRIAADPDRLHAVRIAAGGAQLLLACDLAVAAGFDCLSKLKGASSSAVVNSHEAMPAAFTHNPDLAFPAGAMRQAIAQSTDGKADFLDVTRLAAHLMGDTLAANMMLIGYAWQKGLLPLEEGAILKAIELNGAGVAFNRQAFLWGRRLAHDRSAVSALAFPAGEEPDDRRLSASLDELVERRAAFLADYQDRAWAARYRERVGRVVEAERRLDLADTLLSEAVARSLFALMAVKDEYEVARLFTSGEFAKALSEQFEDWTSLEFHLAPPALTGASPEARPAKRRFGPWLLRLLPLLARLKILRRTPFDPFGRTQERRWERAMLGAYEAELDEILAGLDPANHALAVEIARLPLAVRGFGPVKRKSHQAMLADRERLLALWTAPIGRDAAE